MVATSMAQIPTNLTFHKLTTQYLPFISINTAYIFNDTRASQQLANAVDNPVTIFLSLNTPFQQYDATPPTSGAAGQIEAASVTSAALNSDLFQYLQLDGLHRSTSFNGTSFMRTRFNDTQYEHVSGGQNIEVFRNETAFYVGTGIGFKSNDLEFAGGILHIVDHPMAPPYSLGNTGTVLGINAIAGIIQASVKGPGPSVLPNIQNASDVTVFAPQNSALKNASIASPQVAGNFVVSGSVLYSTALTAGTSFLTAEKRKLFVTTNASGAIFVNGSRIVESDILTANGVVHVIER
ncbi:MAG: hypothetical protein ALECFALPRED_009237 [Alectoria fallacina]|uniref:FAS1 domain-containing protein n=1 Tax=Alectoria fallacina TaxID=1903189 RepID=A0A8H3J6E0_9LECA|nr:MAG: hypothetical protein ALECFALPRED_009237 [Alectoria fallacina]